MLLKSKINKPSKKILAIAFVSSLIIIAGGLYAWNTLKDGGNRRQTKEVDSTSSVKEEQASDKADTPQEPTTLPSKNQSDTTPPQQGDAPTPSTPPEKPDLLRADGGKSIKVVAIFQNTSNGYCELQLSRSGVIGMSQNASIVTGTNYYSCSFNITTPTVQPGVWDLKVIHHIGQATSESSSDLIEITE